MLDHVQLKSVIKAKLHAANITFKFFAHVVNSRHVAVKLCSLGNAFSADTAHEWVVFLFVHPLFMIARSLGSRESFATVNAVKLGVLRRF